MIGQLINVRKPPWGNDRWPTERVQLRVVREAGYGGAVLDVLVGGEIVGQIERFEESHSKKIKGSRLTRGSTRPRTEFRLPGERQWQGDTAGRTVQRLLYPEEWT